MKMILLLLLIVPSIGVGSSDRSGTKLLEYCSQVEALLDGREIEADLGENNAFLCLGYVSGVFDSLYLNNEVCGSNVTDSQQVTVVLDYLTNNSETLHFDRLVLTKAALKQTFFCS